MSSPFGTKRKPRKIGQDEGDNGGGDASVGGTDGLSNEEGKTISLTP